MRRSNMTGNRLRGWFVDLAAGGLVGAVIGGIVAVNLTIYLGVEDGYQAGIGDIFQHSLLAGILVVGVLIAAPGLGVAYARRQRAARTVRDGGLSPDRAEISGSV